MSQAPCERCGTQTDLFCFVHQAPLCFTCASSDAPHATCYVRAHDMFNEDVDVPWPSLCPLCQKPVLSFTDCVRRPCCLDVMHKTCFDGFNAYASAAGETRTSCPICRVSLQPAVAAPVEEVVEEPVVEQSIPAAAIPSASNAASSKPTQSSGLLSFVSTNKLMSFLTGGDNFLDESDVSNVSESAQNDSQAEPERAESNSVAEPPADASITSALSSLASNTEEVPQEPSDLPPPDRTSTSEHASRVVGSLVSSLQSVVQKEIGGFLNTATSASSYRQLANWGDDSGSLALGDDSMSEHSAPFQAFAAESQSHQALPPSPGASSVPTLGAASQPVDLQSAPVPIPMLPPPRALVVAPRPLAAAPRPLAVGVRVVGAQPNQSAPQVVLKSVAPPLPLPQQMRRPLQATVVSAAPRPLVQQPQPAAVVIPSRGPDEDSPAPESQRLQWQSDPDSSLLVDPGDLLLHAKPQPSVNTQSAGNELFDHIELDGARNLSQSFVSSPVHAHAPEVQHAVGGQSHSTPELSMLQREIDDLRSQLAASARESAVSTQLAKDWEKKAERASSLEEDLRFWRRKAETHAEQLRHLDSQHSANNQIAERITELEVELQQKNSQLESSALIAQQLEQTQAELEQSQRQLEQSQIELDQSQQDLVQAQDHIKQLDEHVQSVHSEHQQMQHDLSQSQLALQSSQHDLQVTQHDLQSTQHNLQQTQHDLQTSQHDLQTAQHDLQAVQHDLQASQHEYQVTQHEMHQVQQQLQQYQRDLDLVQNELLQARQQTSDSQPSLTKLQSELDAAMNDLQRTRESLRVAEELLSESQQEVQSLQSASEVSTERMRMALEQWQSTEQQLNEERTQLEELNNQLTEQIRGMEQAIVASEAENSDLISSLTARYDAESRAAADELSVAQRSIESLSAELEQARSALESAQNQGDNNSAALNEASEAANAASAAAQEAAQRAAELAEELNTVRLQLEEKESMLEQYRSTLEELSPLPGQLAARESELLAELNRAAAEHAADVEMWKNRVAEVQDALDEAQQRDQALDEVRKQEAEAQQAAEAEWNQKYEELLAQYQSTRAELEDAQTLVQQQQQQLAQNEFSNSQQLDMDQALFARDQEWQSRMSELQSQLTAASQQELDVAMQAVHDNHQQALNELHSQHASAIQSYEERLRSAAQAAQASIPVPPATPLAAAGGLPPTPQTATSNASVDELNSKLKRYALAVKTLKGEKESCQAEIAALQAQLASAAAPVQDTSRLQAEMDRLQSELDRVQAEQQQRQHAQLQQRAQHQQQVEKLNSTHAAALSELEQRLAEMEQALAEAQQQKQQQSSQPKASTAPAATKKTKPAKVAKPKPKDDDVDDFFDSFPPIDDEEEAEESESEEQPEASQEAEQHSDASVQHLHDRITQLEQERDRALADCVAISSRVDELTASFSSQLMSNSDQAERALRATEEQAAEQVRAAHEALVATQNAAEARVAEIQASASEAQTAAINEKLQPYKVKLVQQQNQLKQLVALQQEFQTRCAQYEERCTQYETELNNAKASDKSSVVAELQQQLQAERDQNANTVTELEGRLAMLSMEKSDLESRASELEQSNSELEQTQHEVQAALKELQHANSQMKNSYDKLQSSQADLQAAVTDLEQANQSLKSELESASQWESRALTAEQYAAQRMQELENEIASLRQQVAVSADAQAEIESLRSQAEQLAQRLVDQEQEMEIDHQTQQQQIQEQLNTIAALQAELEQKCQQLNNQPQSSSDSSQIEAFQVQLTEQSQTIDSLRFELDEKRVQVDALQQQVHELSQQSAPSVSESHAEHDALKQALQEKSSHIEILQAEISQQQSQLASQLQHSTEQSVQLQQHADQVVSLQSEISTLRSTSTVAHDHVDADHVGEHSAPSVSATPMPRARSHGHDDLDEHDSKLVPATESKAADQAKAAKVAALVEKYKRLTAAFTALQTSSKQREQELCNELETLKSDLNSERNQRAAAQDEFANELSQLTEALGEQAAALAAAKSELEATQLQLQQTQASTSSTQHSDELQASLSQSQQQITELQMQLEQMRSQLDASIADAAEVRVQLEAARQEQSAPVTEQQQQLPISEWHDKLFHALRSVGVEALESPQSKKSVKSEPKSTDDGWGDDDWDIEVKDEDAQPATDADQPHQTLSNLVSKVAETLIQLHLAAQAAPTSASVPTHAHLDSDKPLSDDVVTLRAALLAEQSRCADLLAAHRALEADGAAFESETRALRAELARLQGPNSDIKVFTPTTLSSITEDPFSAAIAKTAAAEAKKSAELLVEQWTHRAEKAESDFKTANLKVSELQQQLDAVQAQHRDQIEQLSEQHQQMVLQLQHQHAHSAPLPQSQSLGTDVDELQSLIAKLRVEAQTALHQLHEKSAALLTAESECESLEMRVASAQSKAEDAESEKAIAIERAQELQSAQKQLNARIEELNEQVASLQSQLEKQSTSKSEPASVQPIKTAGGDDADVQQLRLRLASKTQAWTAFRAACSAQETRLFACIRALVAADTVQRTAKTDVEGRLKTAQSRVKELEEQEAKRASRSWGSLLGGKVKVANMQNNAMHWDPVTEKWVIEGHDTTADGDSPAAPPPPPAAARIPELVSLLETLSSEVELLDASETSDLPISAVETVAETKAPAMVAPTPARPARMTTVGSRYAASGLDTTAAVATPAPAALRPRPSTAAKIFVPKAPAPTIDTSVPEAAPAAESSSAPAAQPAAETKPQVAAAAPIMPVLSAPVRPGASLTASTAAPSPSAKRAAAAAALAASSHASSGSDAPLTLGDTDVGTREQAEPVKPAPMPLPVSNTDNGPSKDTTSSDEVSKLRARLAEAEKIAADLRAELAALKQQQSKSAVSESTGDQSHMLKTELRDCQRDRDEERRRRSELEHALQQAESEVRTLRQATPATKSADAPEVSSAGPAPRGTTITVQFSRMFALSVVVLASALAYQSVLSATR